MDTVMGIPATYFWWMIGYTAWLLMGLVGWWGFRTNEKAQAEYAEIQQEFGPEATASVFKMVIGLIVVFGLGCWPLFLAWSCYRRATRGNRAAEGS